MTIMSVAMPVRNRDEFQSLASYLARAIDTRFLHDPGHVPVIALQGSSAKSLAAEVMIKTWMDEHSLDHAVHIPKDNKMFLERFAADACRTVSVETDVAGKKVKLAFNSDEMHSPDDLDIEMFNQFAKATSGGVMIVSNTDYYAFRQSKSDVLLALHVGNVRPGKDAFDRTMHVDVLNEELLSDPRFSTYWKRLIEDAHERAQERPKRQAPPLPGRSPL